jgi:hypothetical protein
VPAVIHARLEGLAHVVGQHDGHASGPAVHGGGAERLAHRVRRRGVDDGVVDQHNVEAAIEAQGPHIPQDVLALGVDRAVDRQHRRRDVGEGEAEAVLEVRGEAAAPRAQFQQGGAVSDLVGAETGLEILGLFAVVLGWREQRPPFGELIVKPW